MNDGGQNGQVAQVPVAGGIERKPLSLIHICIADLVLHVPGGVVHLFTFRAFRPCFLLCRVQVIYLLQFTGDLLAAPMLEPVIQRSAVLVNPQPYDVDLAVSYTHLFCITRLSLSP